jgi:hypothetical protein
LAYSYLPHTAHPGTSLPANAPLNIITPTRLYVRTDNTSSYVYGAVGTGGTKQEQYLAFDPADTSGMSPIQPYDTAVLQSVQTGQWCRLVPWTANASMTGVLCDVSTPASASILTYNGDGLSYQGVDLVAVAPGQPLLLESTARAPVPGPDADNLFLVPAPLGECLALQLAERIPAAGDASAAQSLHEP